MNLVCVFRARARLRRCRHGLLLLLHLGICTRPHKSALALQLRQSVAAPFWQLAKEPTAALSGQQDTAQATGAQSIAHVVACLRVRGAAGGHCAGQTCGCCVLRHVQSLESFPSGFCFFGKDLQRTSSSFSRTQELEGRVGGRSGGAWDTMTGVGMGSA